jgi:hypothetical protein
MSEYLTAAEVKELLVETIAAQVRYARMDFDDAPHDEGDPATGRLSTRESIRGSARLLREMKALPDDDPRILRLAELMPAVDMLMDALPADARISAASADAYLDSLISYAAKAAEERP